MPNFLAADILAPLELFPWQFTLQSGFPIQSTVYLDTYNLGGMLNHSGLCFPNIAQGSSKVLLCLNIYACMSGVSKFFSSLTPS